MSTNSTSGSEIRTSANPYGTSRARKKFCTRSQIRARPRVSTVAFIAHASLLKSIARRGTNRPPGQPVARPHHRLAPGLEVVDHEHRPAEPRALLQPRIVHHHL